ncbi:hypothetical protein BT96DRAFT_914216 [Gymnopus androsaceus JB14]|uniref:Uncharacterized protein n=1 Tax=Gymnopus androsaceus JB14 TaxID=1447944 RepID=A0A6A4IHV2_9AGAR|nr:hypothetical protein BT96DRAFT_914216 [Gymnopus androsaceus JB14]
MHRPSEQPRSLFQPPQHGNNMTRPQIPPQNYPPRQQQRDSPAPTPEPPRVQAQAIPMAADSRKVLRKKSTAHHTNYVADDKPAAMVTLDRADWLAPSTNHPRSKSEMRPPLTAAVARVPLPPPPPMPMPQKDKKVPKRLSKKR